MTTLQEFDFEAANKTVFKESQECASNPTPPLPNATWLLPYIHPNICSALGGRCEWYNRCEERGGCCYGPPKETK